MEDTMQTVQMNDTQLDITERAILLNGNLYTESDCCIAHQAHMILTAVKPGRWSEIIREAWGL